MAKSNSDNFYESDYLTLLNSGSIGFVSKLVHRQIEQQANRKAFKSVPRSKILELGAGKGQHLEFVKDNFLTYIESDFRFANLPQRDKQNFGNPNQQSFIISKEIDAQNLAAFPQNEFDRVIATCLLVHLNDPEKALIEWRRVTKNGGLISIYVPSEPGLLLRFMRHWTTVRKAKKKGYNHLSIHYREHVTYFSRLNLLIDEVFEADSISKIYFPFLIPSWNFNLWTVYTIKLKKWNN